MANPAKPQREVINDADCLIINFFRALATDDDAVVTKANMFPAHESEIFAQQKRLMEELPSLQYRIESDSKYCDVDLAAAWIYCKKLWIAGGLCVPILGGHRDSSISPDPAILDDNPTISRQKPVLNPPYPLLSREFMWRIADRLRSVVMHCGDWKRVVTPVILRSRCTAIFLDPPYTAEYDAEYGRKSSFNVSDDVREWAIEHGENMFYRIALCGYDGEHDMPDNWTVFEWHTTGGFGNQRHLGENMNRLRERIWFSPYCLKADETEVEPSLLEAAVE